MQPPSAPAPAPTSALASPPRPGLISPLGLALVLALGLAGCGTTVSETFSDVGDALESTAPEPSATEAEGSAAPVAEADGTITLETGSVADGPGESIAQALARASSEPTLVNGVFLKDLDGTIWLCESLLESSPPQCGSPRLLVENYPADAGDFDPDSAPITGLQEDGGVLWLEQMQLYGVVRASD